MNVMLTRNPDGTVNAEPGDAVEVLIQRRDGTLYWFPAVITHISNDQDIVDLQSALSIKVGLGPFHFEHVRHARGGAGHLRLQVARLREAVEAIERLPSYELDQAYTLSSEALADVDYYKFEEP